MKLDPGCYERHVLFRKHFCVFLKLNGCDVSICINHTCGLTSVSLRKCEIKKLEIKERRVIETATTRHIKKKSFEKREMFVRSLMWTVFSKQSKINEEVVKVTFIVKKEKQLMRLKSIFFLVILIFRNCKRRCAVTRHQAFSFLSFFFFCYHVIICGFGFHCIIFHNMFFARMVHVRAWSVILSYCFLL